MDDGLGWRTIKEVSLWLPLLPDRLRLRDGLELASKATAHLGLLKSEAQIVSRVHPQADRAG